MIGPFFVEASTVRSGSPCSTTSMLPLVVSSRLVPVLDSSPENLIAPLVVFAANVPRTSSRLTSPFVVSARASPRTDRTTISPSDVISSAPPAICPSISMLPIVVCIRRRASAGTHRAMVELARVAAWEGTRAEIITSGAGLTCTLGETL